MKIECEHHNELLFHLFSLMRIVNYINFKKRIVDQIKTKSQSGKNVSP